MIGGIFGTIGQKLGIGKEKYFLELDDAAEKGVENLKGAATKATKVAKEAASEIADKAQELAGDAVDKAQELAGDAADKAQEAASASQAKAKAAANKAVQKSAKAPSAKTAAQPVVAAKSGPAQPRDTDDIIRAAIANGGQKTDNTGKVIAATTNFSTDFLMPLANTSRRRPGPSLSAFKGMAREVNPRLKG